MKKNNEKRSSFSGKLGFVLSAAGASVGLGNIWRFPYLAAKYGGGIFLLIYIVLALTFGYTMIVAETSIGRMTKKSPVGAFKSFSNSKFVSLGGWINAIIPIPVSYTHLDVYKRQILYCTTLSISVYPFPHLPMLLN